MPLPAVKARVEDVELPDGQKVKVRGLTRTEALAVGTIGEAGEIKAVEVALVAYATDTDADEAKGWYETADSASVQTIVTAATRLSGLDGELGKASSEV